MQPPIDVPMKLLVQLDSVVKVSSFHGGFDHAMDEGSTRSANVAHKVKLPIRVRMDHLVVVQWPMMSLSMEMEMEMERWVGSILAYMATELMSIPRKFMVVAGCVTFSELTMKPSSSHVAIMVVMLLAQTRDCGGPTVK